MRDRLAELRRRAALEGDPPEDSAGLDGPVGDAGAVGRALREAAELWRALEGLERLSEGIERAQQAVLCCTSGHRTAREKRGLSAARAAFTRQALALRPRLDSLCPGGSGGSHTLCPGGSGGLGGSGDAGPVEVPGSAGPRVRQAQLWLLLRRFGALLARHYARESRYRRRLREQILRQAELAGIAMGARDAERLADSPEAPRIVGRGLAEPQAGRQLEARRRQLEELEAQMWELRGLFLQLEGLLGRQQGLADSVEQHVLRSLDAAARGEVKRARPCQRPSRLAALLAAARALCPCWPCLPTPR